MLWPTQAELRAIYFRISGELFISGEILSLTQPASVLHLSVPVSTAEVQNLTENRQEHKRKDGVAVDSAKERGEKDRASCRYWADPLW